MILLFQEIKNIKNIILFLLLGLIMFLLSFYTKLMITQKFKNQISNF